MFSGFKKFILRGNVVDLAIGVVIGAAFTALVSSVVEGFFTPLIGILVKKPDFSDLKLTINNNTFLYGNVINALITFIAVAAVIYFLIVLPLNKYLEQKSPQIPNKKKCPQCLSDIPAGATRCAYCTSVLE